MALDQITKALVADFLENSGTTSRDEPEDYERFSASVTISPLVDGAFDVEDVATGSGGDTGLDAIAVIVNGDLVTDPDDIDVLAAEDKTLNVHFVFVQSETKTSFSTAKIGQIGAGVVDFFRTRPRLSRNDSVTNVAEVAQVVMRHARLFRLGNPICTIYYATAGRWIGGGDLNARRVLEEQTLESLSLFSRVQFVCLGASDIQNRYRALQSGVERELDFRHSTPAPDIEGVKEAHLGYVRAQELLRILQDDDGNLLTSVFYENVRGFQGEANPVNSEMLATLRGPKNQRFVVMNNGITIIAKSVQQTGSRFVIKDFQIVNGCQTCNVLWSLREQLDDDVSVPLRLISTNDEDVTLSVIRATNRQTEVKDEQLFASSSYLKELEAYFSTTEPARRLYLERRSKQYVNDPVERTRIVPFNGLIRSFASLVLAEPHKVTRNYKSLLGHVPNEILNDEHKPAVYYAAASSLYRLEFLFRNGVLARRLSPAKYHILLASRFLVTRDRPGALNGRGADTWARRLLDAYWDASRSEELFLKAAGDIEELAEGDLARDRIRTSVFTDKVLEFYAPRR